MSSLSFLDKYINDDIIIRKLISERCKCADSLYKDNAIRDLARIVKRRKTIPEEKKVYYSIFPPRKQWYHLRAESRKNLNRVKRNERALWLTVQIERGKTEHTEWYEKLMEYVSSIKEKAFSQNFSFTKPAVSLLEKKRDKEKKTIEYRPICKFSRDDAIIASLYNRAMTNLFDDIFYHRSYAFRAVKKDEHTILSHLKAVSAIKDFRRSHNGALYVAECDMKKFYDTIDHDVVKQRFNRILRDCKRENKISAEEYKLMKGVMYSYLDCFNFYHDVYICNCNKNHPLWENVKLPKGMTRRVNWIEEDLKSGTKGWSYRIKDHYKYLLGVPQGGALSGLIANVVMHTTDMRLEKYWRDNPDFLYIRFCDDMIMIGSDEALLSKAFKEYSDSISQAHLFQHNQSKLPKVDDKKKAREFWEGKTKGPYKWNAPGGDAYPWITFVGYDINWEGDTRVRQKSLEKEIAKQFVRVNEIESVLHRNKPKRSREYIMAKVHRQLTGISVGIVPIWDYKNYSCTYCWASAFTQLTDNRWSRKQMKLLDWNRRRLLFRLEKHIKNIIPDDKIEPSNRGKRKRATVRYYGKPYSYYGQCLKMWE